MSLVCYCHGDINQTDAMEIFHSLPQHHSSPDDGAPTQFRKALLLNCGEDISFLFQSFNPSDANSAFTCHIQAGSFLRNPRSDAIRLVLVQFLKEPLYTELRTRQQLGYVVSLSDDSYGRSLVTFLLNEIVRGLFRRGGFTIRILSKEYHPLLLKVPLSSVDLISSSKVLKNSSWTNVRYFKT